MKESVKEITEAVANNPKLSLAVTTALTSNVWVDWGMPIVQGVTSIFGMIVVILLAIKHGNDVKNILKDEKNN